ncbi:MAG: hypothetical protein H6860_04935 [Rhodospirillales bacterium]|nr:hypothetical protein [Alphaproteobacteria bacterium]MCB9981727.1 hypothetical protein [Rhodospirillales bacterium]
MSDNNQDDVRKGYTIVGPDDGPKIRFQSRTRDPNTPLKFIIKKQEGPSPLPHSFNDASGAHVNIFRHPDNPEYEKDMQHGRFRDHDMVTLLEKRGDIVIVENASYMRGEFNTKGSGSLKTLVFNAKTGDYGIVRNGDPDRIEEVVDRLQNDITRTETLEHDKVFTIEKEGTEIHPATDETNESIHTKNLREVESLLDPHGDGKYIVQVDGNKPLIPSF